MELIFHVYTEEILMLKVWIAKYYNTYHIKLIIDKNIINTK